MKTPFLSRLSHPDQEASSYLNVNMSGCLIHAVRRTSNVTRYGENRGYCKWALIKTAPTVHSAQKKENKEDTEGKKKICEVALILQLILEPLFLFWYHTKMYLLPDVW